MNTDRVSSAKVRVVPNRGTRICCQSKKSPRTLQYTATVIIGQDPDEPIVVDTREGSNTQEDFCTFMTMAVANGSFSDGDILIYDNARVYFGADTYEELGNMLAENGIKSFPLPCYIPELNPIERCFGIVKHYLRYHRDKNECFLQEIINAFALITHDIILAEYECSRSYFLNNALTLPPELAETMGLWDPTHIIRFASVFKRTVLFCVSCTRTLPCSNHGFFSHPKL